MCTIRMSARVMRATASVAPRAGTATMAKPRSIGCRPRRTSAVFDGGPSFSYSLPGAAQPPAAATGDLHPPVEVLGPVLRRHHGAEREREPDGPRRPGQDVVE